VKRGDILGKKVIGKGRNLKSIQEKYNHHDRQAGQRGFSFGLTSGVITTLGMIVGLDSATHSFAAVISGILAIAVADAFSDAFGVHISEESSRSHSPKQIWIATIVTFLSKLVIALTFILPFLLMSLSMAIWFSIIWGVFLISAYSFFISVKNHDKVLLVVGEHILITLVVVGITHFVGDMINQIFYA